MSEGQCNRVINFCLGISRTKTHRQKFTNTFDKQTKHTHTHTNTQTHNKFWQTILTNKQTHTNTNPHKQFKKLFFTNKQRHTHTHKNYVRLIFN